MGIKFHLASIVEPSSSNVSCLSNFIGQDSAIRKLRFFVKSASKDCPFPTLLFTGSHGLGKTFLAERVAKALSRELLVVNCGSVKKKDQFISDFLLNISKPTTLFFDESHKLSSEITTLLLTLLNPNKNNKNELLYKGFDIVYDLSLINVIFATTDAHMMFRPLQNRCFQIYFSTYQKSDLIEILKLYLGDIIIDCNLDELSDACRSRARDAFVLAQNIKRYTSLNRRNKFTQEDWSDIKDIFEIFPMGLNKEEVKLLRKIKEYGAISCSNLALEMMVNEDNIKSEIEVRLRELGLIENTTKGRKITEKGQKYFLEYSVD